MGKYDHVQSIPTRLYGISVVYTTDFPYLLIMFNSTFIFCTLKYLPPIKINVFIGFSDEWRCNLNVCMAVSLCIRVAVL